MQKGQTNMMGVSAGKATGVTAEVPLDGRRYEWGKMVLLMLCALLLSVLGSPFLRLLRNRYGSLAYWMSGALVSGVLYSIQLYPSILILGSIWVMVGLYAELEERGWGGFYSLIGSVLVGSAFVLVLFPFFQLDYVNQMKYELTKMLETAGIVDQKAFWFGIVPWNQETFFHLVPSIVVITMLFSQAFAIVFDRRLSLVLGIRFERIAVHIKHLEFKIPDGFIWLLMVSFLLSFLNGVPTWLAVTSMNLFNGLLFLYLFQGLAVVETAFLLYQTNKWLKFFVYIFIIGQLFVLLSVIGIIDYWVDFRSRIKYARIRLDKTRKNGRKCMKVILQKDVKDVGKVGEIVKVSAGFARNFLFPKKLAAEATEKRVKELDHLKRVADIRKKKVVKDREELIVKLNGQSLVVKHAAGDTDKLFGAVTSSEISKELEKVGFSIDRRDIHLEEPIKVLGTHKATIKIGEGLVATVQVVVEKA